MFVFGRTNSSKTNCIHIKNPQSGEGQKITYPITQINYSYFTDDLVTTIVNRTFSRLTSRQY